MKGYNSNRQDWEPVVFSKSKTREKSKPKKSYQNNASGSSRKAQADGDIPNVRKGGKSLANAIRDARNNLGLSQTQLNQKCSLPKNTVQSYENGTATYNAQHVNKLSRVLKVPLPRPQKKRTTK